MISFGHSPNLISFFFLIVLLIFGTFFRRTPDDHTHRHTLVRAVLSKNAHYAQVAYLYLPVSPLLWIFPAF